jgi:hypothetical protein
MNCRDAPRRIKEQISVQTVAAETLVYDERRHMAFCLNLSCSAIWRLATGEHTIGEISQAASIELGTEISEEFAMFAVEEMRRDGLIEPSGAVVAAEPVSRRILLQRLGAGGVMLLPAVAAIIAPTAAQAYRGCFDCSDSESVQARELARARQIERARLQERKSPGNIGAANDTGFPGLFPLDPLFEDESTDGDPPN